MSGMIFLVWVGLTGAAWSRMTSRTCLAVGRRIQETSGGLLIIAPCGLSSFSRAWQGFFILCSQDSREQHDRASLKANSFLKPLFVSY